MNEHAPLHIRIVSGNELVADLPDWPGPVPRAGEYVFHPPFGNQDVIPDQRTGISGSIKTVTWRLYDRTPQGTGFVQTARPFIEITI